MPVSGLNSDVRENASDKPGRLNASYSGGFDTEEVLWTISDVPNDVDPRPVRLILRYPAELHA
ncbi:hypothetical protein FKP32DRAFT_1671568 [Trametes sanguinea]|nr:hypothetical protein FKP32DRAFT_1671568 [Trametes sanguinea]